MGKGIGSIKLWVSWVKIGQIILEVNNISVQMAKNILKEASYRLPIKVSIIYREVINRN